MKKLKLLLTTLVITTILTACNSNQTEILETPDISNAPSLPSPTINDDEALISPSIDDGSVTIDPNHFGEFTATTLTGDEISNDIFSDYDVTMVNIWATWCSPCVREMPDLAELYTLLPENTNLITICSDASTQEELANAILEDAGAEFHTAIDNDEINLNILSRITSFPTSVFVDKNGLVVHAISGAPNTDDIASVYLAIIDEVLDFVTGEDYEEYIA